jgi:hypothetical protein
VKYVECAAQAELDKALANKKPDEIVVCTGGTWSRPLVVSGSASVRASGSASVRASGSASVEASGSASVRASGSASVEASGSASVEASGSASVRASGSASVRASGSASVEASGSASVEASGSASVEASGSASVRAYDSASVQASKYVAIHKHPASGYGTPKITGGVVIEIPKLDTPQAWLDYHGIPVVRGVAVLYKAVDDGYGANHNGFKYEPGTIPEAPDWDPHNGCGNGLHFCARPLIAKDKYHPNATRFVGCPVKVTDLVVIDESKVKAPRVCKPCFEVDKHGDPINIGAAA